MPAEHEQKITELTGADQKHLHDQRAVVEKFLGNEDSKRSRNHNWQAWYHSHRFAGRHFHLGTNLTNFNA